MRMQEDHDVGQQQGGQRQQGGGNNGSASGAQSIPDDEPALDGYAR